MPVSWFYLKDETDFPVACVATRLNNGLVDFALSIRNLKDEYNAKRGREIAVGRLLKNKHTKSVPSADSVVRGEMIVLSFLAKSSILSSIMEDRNVPMRVRAAAGYRLALLKERQRAWEAKNIAEAPNAG